MSKKSSTFALAFEKEATGSSSARLECLLWEQEVVSSNLAYPTNQKKPLKRVASFFVYIRYTYGVEYINDIICENRVDY